MIKACYITNTGKIRLNNEDSLLVNGILISAFDMTEPVCIEDSCPIQVYMVADGMGGHARGEVASRTVLEVFRKDSAGLKSGAEITDTAVEAKRTLDRIVLEDPAVYGLGTTVAGIAIAEGKVIAFNCGDSRVYEWNERGFRRITKDHSVVQELLELGSITTEEGMRTHPYRNVLTSSVIGGPASNLPELFFAHSDAAPGRKFLICSDGVWESVSGSELASFMSLDPASAAAELFRRIMARGAEDNLSFIIVETAS